MSDVAGIKSSYVITSTTQPIQRKTSVGVCHKFKKCFKNYIVLYNDIYRVVVDLTVTEYQLK